MENAGVLVVRARRGYGVFVLARGIGLWVWRVFRERSIRLPWIGRPRGHVNAPFMGESIAAIVQLLRVIHARGLL